MGITVMSHENGLLEVNIFNPITFQGSPLLSRESLGTRLGGGGGGGGQLKAQVV